MASSDDAGPDLAQRLERIEAELAALRSRRGGIRDRVWRGIGATGRAIVAGLLAGAVVAALDAALGMTAWALSTPTANPAVYVAITPCRAADTRVSSGGAGPVQPGGAGQAFTVVNTGSGAPNPGGDAGCGIPADATAVAINVAATNFTANGNADAFPTGGSDTSSTVNYTANDYATANGVHVGLGRAQQVTVATHTAAADIVIDIVGYYVAPPAAPHGMAFTLYGQPAQFVVPQGVTVVQVELWGGGGGGGCAGTDAGTGGGGGGQEGQYVRALVTVVPGVTYTMTPGSGGNACSGSSPATAGQPTVLAASGTPVVTVGGGGPGANGHNCGSAATCVGAPGSGGGAGATPDPCASGRCSGPAFSQFPAGGPGAQGSCNPANAGLVGYTAAGCRPGTFGPGIHLNFGSLGSTFCFGCSGDGGGLEWNNPAAAHAPGPGLPGYGFVTY